MNEAGRIKQAEQRGAVRAALGEVIVGEVEGGEIVEVG